MKRADTSFFQINDNIEETIMLIFGRLSIFGFFQLVAEILCNMCKYCRAKSL